jgi:hypothetical protein
METEMGIGYCAFEGSRSRFGQGGWLSIPTVPIRHFQLVDQVEADEAGAVYLLAIY